MNLFRDRKVKGQGHYNHNMSTKTYNSPTAKRNNLNLTRTPCVCETQ